jgi:hypothetical protein
VDWTVALFVLGPAISMHHSLKGPIRSHTHCATGNRPANFSPGCEPWNIIVTLLQPCPAVIWGGLACRNSPKDSYVSHGESSTNYIFTKDSEIFLLLSSHPSQPRSRANATTQGLPGALSGVLQEPLSYVHMVTCLSSADPEESTSPIPSLINKVK